MPPSLNRRKRGIIIGLGLMSAAALVAFGTAKYASSRKKGKDETSAEGDGTEAQDGETGNLPAEDLEDRGLWQRARELGQAVWLLATNRRVNDS